VRKVVALILEHAREYPSESLGVIALGIKHAERIDAALRDALATISEGEDAKLEAFFADDAAEPFFVKNLERVQGDERDAIILSIGYGKHPDGRMRYQWGPLLRDGGERRLNVAATRAKHRLTLVSSFSGHDVDPDRVTKAGARLLADYLDYASSGGTAPEASGAADLDSFEANVRDRLADCGVTVVPQYGVGGYRVDFAAVHPEDPGRMVLAIEADGASYRESGSVRDRDRLRGEHLQRLGWRYHRLWSTSWFQNPDAEIAKLQAAYEDAVADVKPTPRPQERPAAGAAGEPAAGSHVGGSPVRVTADGSPLDAESSRPQPAADGDRAEPEPRQPEPATGTGGPQAVAGSPGRAQALATAVGPRGVAGPRAASVSPVAEIEAPRSGKEIGTVGGPLPDPLADLDGRTHVER
jgi:very-short-patch-repair endonuclease